MGSAAMTTAITLFTVPKAFTGEFERIQTNAIRSWIALGVEEIVLFGDDDGVQQTAYQEQVTWGGAVERNEFGTPLLSDVFDLGEKIAHTPLVCYVNCDIILFPDFLKAVVACAQQFQHFLLCGQRSNVDYGEHLRFNPLTASVFRSFGESHGKRLGVGGADFFCYCKGDLGEIPPFAIGRFRNDNWLMWRALEKGLAFVDGTDAVFAAHQNHSMHHDPNEHGLEYNNWLISQNGGVLGRLSDANWTMTADFQLHEWVNI